MYNTTIICTYNSSEIFLDDDNINEKEKEFIRDVIYRQELLNIFEIDDYNEIDRSIHDLYQLIKDNNFIKECIIKLASKYMSNDAKIGLMIMFSYDLLYLTHICICELLETNKISETNQINLRSIIFNIF
jgi:hypothetical protein